MTSTQSGASKTCPSCGNTVHANAQFCPFCSASLTPAEGAPAEPAAPTTPIVAPPVPVLSAAEPANAANAPNAAHRAQCEMIIGYLVPHRCDNPALGRCVQCGRGYCDEHVSVTPRGLVCMACQQGLQQPIAIPLTAQTYDAADIATFHAASMWDDDDDTFSDLS